MAVRWTGDSSGVSSCVFSPGGGWDRLQQPCGTECRCGGDIRWCGNEKALSGPTALLPSVRLLGCFRLHRTLSRAKKAMHLLDHLDSSQEMSPRVALSATRRDFWGFNHAATRPPRRDAAEETAIETSKFEAHSFLATRLWQKCETCWEILWKMSRPEKSPLLQIFAHVTVYWPHRGNVLDLTVSKGDIKCSSRMTRTSFQWRQ